LEDNETLNFELTFTDNPGQVDQLILGWQGSTPIAIDLDSSNTTDLGHHTYLVNVDYTNDTGNDIDIDSLTLHSSNQGFGLDEYKVSYSSTSDQVLTIDENDVDGDEIDMAQLLSSSEDFEPHGTPDSLDEINISEGEHILSNLSLDDFLSMTDDDNTLKITSGDGNDTLRLNMTDDLSGSSEHWYDTGLDVSEDGTTYSTYTNAADTSIQLLIENDITVEDI
jgi:hypothetical protein